MGRIRSMQYGWVVVATVSMILMVGSGARFVYGVIFKTVSNEFEWDRSTMTIAILINMVVLSICQPLTGYVVDRFGSRKVIVTGSLLLGLAQFPLSQASTLWQFWLWYGIVSAIALAAVSPVNVTALVGRWFTEKRGTALSIATSGTAFGQLLIVPVAAWLMTSTSWHTTYMILGVALVGGAVPLGWFLLRDAPIANRVLKAGESAAKPVIERPSKTLREALAASNFWLLSFGFFVCGFTMAFQNTHFVAYADDMGMGAIRASRVVAVTAIFSITGSVLLGILADRHQRRYVLSATYFLRGLAFVLLLVLPKDNLIFFYAMILGISWTATTPLTAAMATDFYGPKNIGLIFGLMFTFMNIGFGAGSFLDGLAYDLEGGYSIALVINATLGVLAAVVVLGAANEREVDSSAELTAPAVVPAAHPL